MSLDRPANSRVLTRPEVEQDQARYHARSEHLFDRWTLGLAVANGGALTALGGKMLDLLSKGPSAESAATLGSAFPSLWLFAAGLGAIGISQVMGLKDVLNQSSRGHDYLAMMDADPEAYVWKAAGENNLRSFLLRWGATSASALLFAAGLAYPVFVLTTRLVRSGSFFG